MIADKYRVTGVIGEGGMGVVVAAEHTQLGRQVAIKFLHPSASPTVAERFAREGRIAVRLQSEHVCKVYDVGQLPTGQPYMVMEFLQGQDLAQLVAAHGAPQTPAAVDFVLQACEALAEAHVLGVVHRDLKPGNLFLTQRIGGSVCIKVLDFGISKMYGTEAHGAQPLTMAGSVLGSPRFISPEQLANTGEVDLRSDIWALGAVLHELLSGQAAFAAETVGELCFEILNDEPTPLDQLRPDVSPGLAAAVSRCLAKDPSQRYQNVAELALALQPFGSGAESVSVQRAMDAYKAQGWTPPADLAPASQAVPATAAPAPSKTTEGAPKSGKGPMIAIALAAVVLLGAVGAAVLVGSSETSSAKSEGSQSRVTPSAASSASADPSATQPRPVEPKAAEPAVGRAFWCYRVTDLAPMSSCSKTKAACEKDRAVDAKSRAVSACELDTSVTCVTWKQADAEHGELQLELCFVSPDSCAAFRLLMADEPPYKGMSACGPAR